ncbi:oligopeptide/dipeptide ABC transporter ATP-binding protein [Microvirga sp. P5_D2]
MNMPVLELRKVSQTYTSRDASGWGWTTVRAVDGVDLTVHQGETLAIVGESGSGKSTMAKLLLMLNRPTQGEVVYRGQPLPKLASAVRSEYRRNVQAVFQDPSSSLNPRMTVEQSLGYVVRRHDLVPQVDQKRFIEAQLDAVGLTPPEKYTGRFPHQLSGGQQQRVAIARAMMLEPSVIIADEPLSSLDVSIQSQVLQLMRELRDRTNVAFVIISHDLGAMESIADRTAVMYRGRIVEIGRTIYSAPVHPYTRLLLDARLIPDPRRSRIRSAAFKPPAPVTQAASDIGCGFRNRCPFSIDICAVTSPPLRPVGEGTTLAACHRAEEITAGWMTEKKAHEGRG